MNKVNNNFTKSANSGVNNNNSENTESLGGAGNISQKDPHRRTFEESAEMRKKMSADELEILSDRRGVYSDSRSLLENINSDNIMNLSKAEWEVVKGFTELGNRERVAFLQLTPNRPVSECMELAENICQIASAEQRRRAEINK